MEINACQFPDDLLYDVEGNVWVWRGSETLIVGATCIFAFIAGKIEAVKFKPIGSKLQTGMSIATVESSKYFGVVRSPVGGELVEVNNELLGNPSLANKHPYTGGWFARISPSDWKPENLLSTAQAEPAFRLLVEKFHVRCFYVYPDYEVSGIGGECPETLGGLDELMKRMKEDQTVHLVTDNKLADADVPNWAFLRGYRMLETRREGSLLHFIMGK
ncbi:MAG: sulfurtransferase TusA family protein [Nitrososphaerota archaeon]|jgi:glycine cleavage system H protein|nr:sulfurtransferase TusA family protein [Nitrososphaerota archaeon]